MFISLSLSHTRTLTTTQVLKRTFTSFDIWCKNFVSLAMRSAQGVHADECESVRVSIIRVRVFVHSKEECVSERERVREIETSQVTNRCVRSETGPSRSSPKIKCTRKMTSVRVKEIIPYFFPAMEFSLLSLLKSFLRFCIFCFLAKK